MKKGIWALAVLLVIGLLFSGMALAEEKEPEKKGFGLEIQTCLTGEEAFKDFSGALRVGEFLILGVTFGDEEMELRGGIEFGFVRLQVGYETENQEIEGIVGVHFKPLALVADYYVGSQKGFVGLAFDW